MNYFESLPCQNRQTFSLFFLDSFMKKYLFSRLAVAACILLSAGTAHAQWNGLNPLWTNSLVGLGVMMPADRLHISYTYVPDQPPPIQPIARWSTADPNRAGQIGIITGTTPWRYLTNMANAEGDFIVAAGVNNAVFNDDLILTNRTPNGRIRFGTSLAGGVDTEKMTITAQGKVGIGTTNPLGQLDVNLGAWNHNLPKISFNKTGNAPSLRFYHQTGNPYPPPPPTETDAEAYPWYIDVSGVSDIGRMTFLSGPRTLIGSETVRPVVSFLYTKATTSGSVGIENINPQATLHVGTSPTDGTIRFGSVEYIRDAGSNHVMLGGGIMVTSDYDNSTTLGSSSLRWQEVFAANGTINTSDIRQKENIRDISYGLREVMQLHPVSFTWKGKSEQGTKLGVIAQEIQKVLPEVVNDPSKMVRYNEDGSIIPNDPNAPLGVYYSDIIPVLVKAIQEQQAVIEQNTSDIAELRTRIAQLEAASGNSLGTPEKGIDVRRDILLEQNSPNPFSDNTTIVYFIPEGITGKVELVIADASGNQVLQRFAARLNTPDKITVSARDLQPGVYLYGVTVNGSIITSKKMMILK